MLFNPFSAFRVRTWALDVADDAAGCVVHKLDADLGHATTGACIFVRLCPSRETFSSMSRKRTGAAEDSGDLDELDGNPTLSVSLQFMHVQRSLSNAYFAESIFAFVRCWSVRLASFELMGARGSCTWC